MNNHTHYYDELLEAMTWLGCQKNTIFLGQAVAYPGTSMTGTLADVPKDKLLEFPVAEDMQMGASIGLSLAGYVPISIYPRWNFLLLATNQIVNHLDKLPRYSDYRPKVIIRTAVATPVPLDPQAQHLGNYSEAFRQMLKTVDVIELLHAADILPAYQWAFERKDGWSTLIVEHTDKLSS